MVNLQCRIFTSEIDIIEWDWNKFQPHLFTNNGYCQLLMFCCHCLPCISPFYKNLRSQILVPSPYLPASREDLGYRILGYRNDYTYRLYSNSSSFYLNWRGQGNMIIPHSLGMDFWINPLRQTNPVHVCSSTAVTLSRCHKSHLAPRHTPTPSKPGLRG